MEYKIDTNGIPYIPVKTDKDNELVFKVAKLVWYECNGQIIFEIKDKNGIPTGEHVAFLLLL